MTHKVVSKTLAPGPRKSTAVSTAGTNMADYMRCSPAMLRGKYRNGAPAHHGSLPRKIDDSSFGIVEQLLWFHSGASHIKG